jgi:paraquat-inducible protein A
MDELLPAEDMACHECDLLNKVPALAPGQVAKCARCNATLYRNVADCVDKTLALAFSSLILFVVANIFPFLGFGKPGMMRTTSLISGVADLHAQGMSLLALIVFATSILIPALQIAGLIYILLPLRQGYLPYGLNKAFRFLLHMRPWGMVEIFLVGILVAFVKLAGMAEIVPGVALWAFATLMLTLTWASASLEPKVVWHRVESLR